jgi:hypothetical protein
MGQDRLHRVPSPGRFVIEAEEPEAVVGRRANYRVPAAVGEREDGRLLCDWAFEHDASTPASQQSHRQVPRANFQQPRARVFQDWAAVGTHKVICNVRFERHQGAGAPPTTAPPPETGRLELPVNVRTLSAISHSRFESTATQSAYMHARLAPHMEEERARRDCIVETPDVADQRRRRVETMQRESGRIDPDKRVIARAQLTLADGSRTLPLAIVIGQTAHVPGELSLVDFTPGVRRMDIGSARTSDQLLANLERRNSYPAGLVEIEVPRNNWEIGPMRRTFQTDGRSAMGEASDIAGGASMLLMGGAMATAMFPPLSVCLFLLGAVAGVASNAISMVERAHDAQPDPQGFVLDALGVVSSLLGGGAGAVGNRVVNIGGRTMRAVNVLGGAAMAADSASVVLMTIEGIAEIRAINRDTTVPEEERYRRIAQRVTQLAMTGGLVVLSNASQASAMLRPRGGGQPRTDQDYRGSVLNHEIASVHRPTVIDGLDDGERATRTHVGHDLAAC